MDCIFCKIKEGTIPSKKIYEDDLIMVIMDISPNVDGHVLVIPKEHYTTFIDLPNDIIIHINKVVKSLTPTLLKAMNVDSLTQINNYGTMQEVKHYHLHLLPNYGINLQANKTVDESYEQIKKFL